MITPIYNKSGIQIDELSVDDDITFLEGRVSKGKTLYYKGIGCYYKFHQINDILSPNDYSNIQKSDVFYAGYTVSKICYQNKFGIFQEPYQTFFPDFIGTCSQKEGNIVLNSYLFEKTSVEVIDCIQYDKINNQSYYILDYSCKRQKYLNHPNPKYLRDLIEYTVQSNWNFLWDKTSINDITYNGLVSDVADLFQSTALEHKLGSVYSVLYSLGKLNHQYYLDLLKEFNLEHINDKWYVFNAVSILSLNNVNVEPLLPGSSMSENYKHIVKNYLVTGKNCAYCACDMFAEFGEQVKSEYSKMIENQINKI
nr:MAG: hypothetical protein [Caudoviricetes sp.]